MGPLPSSSSAPSPQPMLYIGRWKNAWNCLFLITITYVYYFYLLFITLSLYWAWLLAGSRASVQTTWPKQNFCIIMAHAEFLVQGCQIYQKRCFFHTRMHKSEVPFCKCNLRADSNGAVRQWHSDSWDSCRLRHSCENKFMHTWGFH